MSFRKVLLRALYAGGTIERRKDYLVERYTTSDKQEKWVNRAIGFGTASNYFAPNPYTYLFSLTLGASWASQKMYDRMAPVPPEVFKHRSDARVPTFVTTGIASFVENEWVRRNMKWPSWIYTSNRDVGVIDSVCSGKNNTDWGVDSYVIDRFSGETFMGTFRDTSDVEVYNGGINSGTPGTYPKVFFKYNQVDISTFEEGVSRWPWNRTLFRVRMPQRPGNAGNITGAYLVIEPTRVTCSDGGGESYPGQMKRNQLVFEDYDDKNIDPRSVSWHNIRTGRTWEEAGMKDGGYVPDADDATKYDNFFGYDYSACWDIPVGSPSVYWITSGRTVRPFFYEYGLAGPTDYSIDASHRDPRGLGPIIIPLYSGDADEGKFISWEENKTLFAHWKYEFAGDDDVQLDTLQNSSWNMTVISTMTATDNDNWNPFNGDNTAKTAYYQLGGALEWTTFPTKRKVHLVVTYEKVVPEDTNVYFSIPSVVTDDGNDFGDTRDNIDFILRGRDTSSDRSESIDYIRNAPMSFANTHSLDSFIDMSIVADGKRMTFAPRNTFDDSWLRQTPEYTKMVGSIEYITANKNRYVEVSGQKTYAEYPGSRVCLVLFDTPITSTADASRVYIYGRWGRLVDNSATATHSYDAEFVDGCSEAITIDGTSNNYMYILIDGYTDGADVYPYLNRIDNITIDGMPIEGYVGIAPLCFYNPTASEITGDYKASPPTNEYIVLPHTSSDLKDVDMNFFNLRAGEPVLVPGLTGIEPAKTGEQMARVWAVTDYATGRCAKGDGKYYTTLVAADPDIFDAGEIPATTYKAAFVPIGDGLIYILPRSVTGTVLKRSTGFGQGGLTDDTKLSAMSVPVFGVAPKIHEAVAGTGTRWNGTPPSLELVSASVDSFGNMIDEVYTPMDVPIFDDNLGITLFELDMETEITSTSVEAGKELYIRIPYKLHRPMPDEIRLEWNSHAAWSDWHIDFVEHVTTTPSYIDGQYAWVGPLSFTSYFCDANATYDGLRIYSSLSTGIDTEALAQIADFSILIDGHGGSAVKSSVEVAAFPLSQTTEYGNAITLRFTRATCVHQNYSRDDNTVDGYSGTEYFWELYVDVDGDGTPELKDSGSGNTTVFSISVDDDTYIGRAAYIKAWAVFTPIPQTTPTTIVTPSKTITVEITECVEDAGVANGTYKYLGIGPVGYGLGSGIKNFTDGIERDITAVVAADGSVTFTDNGKQPISTTVTGVVKEGRMLDDIAYLNDIVDNGRMVYWDIEESDCTPTYDTSGKTYNVARYYGKAASISYDVSRPNDREFSLSVVGLRKIMVSGE